MLSVRGTAILALACVLSSSGCGGGKSAGDSAAKAAGGAKVLNLYIWSDYLAPDTLPNFENRFGIKVHPAYYDTNETLETKLLAGNSGFDVVVPSASYFERQIKAGTYLALDKSNLPNWQNMDPQLMPKVSSNNLDNTHAQLYLCGTHGLSYTHNLAKALMP